MDPSCNAEPDDLNNCQGCGWSDNLSEAGRTPGYTITTHVAWSQAGAAFWSPQGRFVIRLCRRCAVRLALQVLDHEVG